MMRRRFFRPVSRRRLSARRLNRWQPRLFHLENRFVPCTPSFSGGILAINCDDFDSTNTLQVETNGTFLFDGLPIAGNPTLANTTAITYAGNGGTDIITFGPGITTPATVSGGNGNDQLFTSDGDDFVIGGAGDDLLNPGFGANTVEGGVGFDTVQVVAADSGSSLSFTLPVGTDIERLEMFGGNGNDTLQIAAPTGVQILLDGKLGDDVLIATGADGTVTLLGGAGNDSLVGGKGNDSLSGGDGDDVLKGGPGDDTLDGGNGTDAADSGPGLGTDTLISIEASIVAGTDSGDLIDLSGKAGPFFIEAGGGNDTIIGSSGNDTMIGGDGDDSIVGGDGRDQVRATGNGSFTLTDTSLSGQGNDVLSGVEEASLQGGTGNDTFTVSAFTGAATLHGGGGDNQVISKNNADFCLGECALGASGDVRQPEDQSRALLTRSTGGTFSLVDVLRVNLTGGASNNTFTVNRFAGAATLNGGAGKDRVAVTADASLILTDTKITRSGGESFALTGVEQAGLTGGVGNEILDASAFTRGGVTLVGGDGHDTLKGSAQADTLDGGTGNDELSGRAGADTLTGGDGLDTLKGGGGDDRLLGDLGNDFMTGGGGNDFLDGGDGTDIINGGPGTDRCRNAESKSNCP